MWLRDVGLHLCVWICSCCLSSALSQRPKATALRLEDIAFGVLTCGRYHDTRLKAQRRTWLHQLRNVVAFSDTDGKDLDIEVVIDKSPPQKSEMLLHDGALRTLSMVEGLHARHPRAKWYFFVDDDTYVYVSTLVRDVLANRDPADVHYVGFPIPMGPRLRRHRWQWEAQVLPSAQASWSSWHLASQSAGGATPGIGLVMLALQLA